jgi:hypothetical protein
VEVTVEIVGKSSEERNVRMAFPTKEAEVTKLKGTDDRYAIGTAIPLETFPSGNYTIRIEVFDSVLRKKYQREKVFQIGKT